MSRGLQTEVSVIIPCHDASASLPRQLASLAAQEAPPPFDVLVVDNGDNAGLDVLVEAWRPSVSGLRVVEARGEAGAAYARNVGIEATTSPKLLFCDDDDVVSLTWVRDGAAVLEQAAAFSGGAVMFTPEEIDQDLASVQRLLNERLTTYEPDAADMLRGEYPVLLGCSFGMTRAVAEALGGFDRAFGSHAEDNDLAFRLQHHLGALPRAAHVAIAYRVRRDGEHSMARSVRAGFRHAMLCGRHDAWHVSPSYAGHWLLRPVREAMSPQLHQTRTDILARLAGLAVGRVWFAGGRHQPPVRLGTARQE